MKKSLVNILLILSITTLLTGCMVAAVGAGVGAGAGAGAGTVAYIQGASTASVAGKIDDAYSSTSSILKNGNYTIISQSKGAKVSTITAYPKDDSDNKITINLTQESNTVVYINVRVNTFGDQKISEPLLKEIQKEMKFHTK